MTGDRYILWGSAGHAKVLASLLAQRGDRVIALFDNDSLASPALPDVPLYIGEASFMRWAEQTPGIERVWALVAIGGGRGRERLAIQALMQHRGLRMATLVHPTASTCASAALGAGSQVLAHAIVAAEARLGEACIVNHRASVDHECTVGRGVHFAPGATLCGCVSVGDGVLIGACAVVLPRLRIGDDAIVGAGAVVTRDVPPRALVTGNPARVVRYL
jgi:sugar O-acyltransferase (sialic acid O-acetyltransferase NeuD family)